MPIFYGYGRASTDKQTVSTHQQEAKVRETFEYYLKIGKLPPDTVWGGFFRDEATGRTTKFREREQGSQLLARAKPGDIICVSNFDRIFANVIDVCETIEIIRERQINLHIIDADVDISSQLGQVFFKVMAIFKELERNEIARRVREMAEYRKQVGLPMGQPPLGWKSAKVGSVGGQIRSYYIPNQTHIKMGKALLEYHAKNPTLSLRKLHVYFQAYIAKDKVWSWESFLRFYRAAQNAFPLPNGSHSPAPIPVDAKPLTDNTVGEWDEDDLTSFEPSGHVSPESSPLTPDEISEIADTLKPARYRQRGTPFRAASEYQEPGPPASEPGPSEPPAD